MKKIIAAALSVIGVTSLAFAVACNEEAQPTYYKLTYEAMDGVTLDFGDIMSGADVKDGYVVSFTYSQTDDVLGDARILLNNEEIEADDNGVYSFTMKSDSSITVSGVYKLSTYTVTFDTDNNDFIKFNFEGDDDTTATVEAGDTISFSLDVSVYYGENPTFDVLADTQVIKPDANGVYTATIIQDTKITTSGLALDNLEPSFLARENCGSGTKADPYLISRPVDLYVMADIINDDWYVGTYSKLYYKLVADIDMKGERLYVIGDGTTDYAFFCGSFDGNGHTISNYTMQDTLIEQDTYTETFVNYIGLFGQAAATSSRKAEIFNLNLKDFTITVDKAAKYSQAFWVGGVAGIAAGADIYGCTTSGTITINADNDYLCYAGGIAGYFQSAYQSETLKYTASIINCGSDVDIRGLSGLVYAAGGITGALYTANQSVPAYIINCYNRGEISRVLNVGGIAGIVNSYSSIKNCYSYAGTLEARSTYTGTYEAYKYAYVGGIAAYVENDAIVSNSYSSSSINATSISTGTQYRVMGNVIGYLSPASTSNILSSAAISLNNYSLKGDNITFSKDFAINTLGWSERDWNFDGSVVTTKYSTVAPEITINFASTDTGVSNWTKRIALDEYRTLADWYSSDADLSEYVTANGLRSYGYFVKNSNDEFVKVPYSYVLSGNETLYAGFADYNNVSGIYYINTTTNGSNIHFVFNADGSAAYVDGAMSYSISYYYDGTYLYISENPAFSEVSTSTDSNGNTTSTTTYTTARVSVNGNNLTAVNGITYLDNSPLTAIKKLVVEGNDFVYGQYLSSDNTIYTFNTDGTGTAVKGGTTSTFTYKYENGALSLDNSYVATVVNGKVTSLASSEQTITLQAYDAFVGTWEKSATTHKEFTFDGLGNWTYSNYGYKDGEKVELDSTVEGTYTYADGGEKLILSNTQGTVVGEAIVNANGFVEVTYNSALQTYYKKSSFTGEWRFAYRGDAVDLTINGIGTDGVGYGSVKYESLSTAVAVTYDVRTAVSGTTSIDYIYIFLNGDAIGYLTFDSTNSTLAGQFYSNVAQDYVNAVFCLKDDFNGKWISSPFESIQFSGYGLYSIAGSAANNTLAVSGTVTINDAYKATYKIDTATNVGQFVFNNKLYQIVYNEATNVVEVTEKENTEEGAVLRQFEAHRLDNWYGYTFVDENSNTYSFNGGGTLADGGKVTVTSADGTSTRYIYKVEGNATNVYDVDNGNLLGTIEVVGNKYQFIGAQLTISTKFTGEWIVGGDIIGDDNKLVIGDIGVDGKAEGTYLGTAVQFTYSISLGTLSFVYNNNTLTLRALGTANAVELSLSNSNSISATLITCVKASTLDEFIGKYQAADGGYVKLDGLGNSVFGNGTASQYDVNGTLVALYNYSINSFGMIELKISTSSRRIFKQVAVDTQGAYVLNGKAYTIVTPDFLYNVSAYDGAISQLVYTFDGVGGLVTSTGLSYTYVIQTQSDEDSVDNLYRLTITSADGTVYEGELDYGSSDYKLTLTAKN